MTAIEQNGIAGAQAVEAPSNKIDSQEPQSGSAGHVPLIAQRQRSKPSLKDSRQIFVIGAGLVLVLLLLLFSGISKRPMHSAKISQLSNKQGTELQKTVRPSASLTPIMDVAPAAERNGDEEGAVNSSQIAATAKKHASPDVPPNLGSIAPFEDSKSWRPPAYRQASQAAQSPVESAAVCDGGKGKSEAPSMDKPSLVFVANHPAAASDSRNSPPEADWGIGLLPGARLRARLESAVNTAVRTPVVAVIEYNYEQGGEVVVPAGSRIFGHLEAADRSGYLGIRFDSLTMPDGSSLPLEAAATDLELRPLRGKVQGKHTGKNILVRSLAGVGEIGATLVGRGSLNQPLSEGDLLRERVSNNLGQASDQTVANLALTENPVISVPAGAEIYVVLQKPPRQEVRGTRAQPAAQTAGQINIDQLRQLLQLEVELNQANNSKGSPE